MVSAQFTTSWHLTTEYIGAVVLQQSSVGMCGPGWLRPAGSRHNALQRCGTVGNSIRLTPLNVRSPSVPLSSVPTRTCPSCPGYTPYQKPRGRTRWSTLGNILSLFPSSQHASRRMRFRRGSCRSLWRSFVTRVGCQSWSSHVRSVRHKQSPPQLDFQGVF